ncbi:hypothetical protein [Deinococcus soli (ex Cha et al. 2016)]|uniref:Uncharacterized protein n=2 Tax=Deinococcus soli (ex Cha et al. 2016) TaxID=1309411 RepID=A0ACC6KH78_9DEIO|nr:hypothetical protein [Deinococcus soli (ex Cha et al. 2016)]MDR6218960.1 hypothetical protein [Deinococcus soli (ex Cha et al. 2016)]MDR6328757.1 hypothetical protein [Deinococcus soli (ex Cha et al. 2016)]MDR6751756.1 hypothetical protein [Deinococcus soli (ex Cha et al. 2016)]
MPDFKYRLTADRWAFLDVTVRADTREASDALIAAQSQALAQDPALWHHDDALSSVRTFLTPEQVEPEGGNFQSDVTIHAP